MEPETPQDPDAERLMAVISVSEVLTPGAKIRLTAGHRTRAAKLPETIRTEVRRFLAASEFDGERELPAFAYKEALEHLTSLDPEERITELSATLPEDDTAAGVVVVAARILRMLKDILPKRSRMTWSGPVTGEPSDLVKYRFRRAYAVAEDPMEVLRELREGCLARDQVRALKAMYPSLYEEALHAVFEEMAELKARRPNMEIPRPKARMLETLFLTRTWTPALGKMLQKAFAEKGPEDGPQKNRPLGKSAESMSTPVQRAAER